MGQTCTSYCSGCQGEIFGAGQPQQSSNDSHMRDITPRFHQQDYFKQKDNMQIGMPNQPWNHQQYLQQSQMLSEVKNGNQNGDKLSRATTQGGLGVGNQANNYSFQTQSDFQPFKSQITMGSINNSPAAIRQSNVSIPLNIPSPQMQSQKPKITQKDPVLNCSERKAFPAVLLDNGGIYMGEWLRGQRDGQGYQEWPDSSRYIGEWRNDKANGFGKLFHSDGDVYEGDWVDDQAHGNGKYIHSNGAIYEGQWIHDKQQGLGVEVWPDGAHYEGQFYDGKKEGQGILKFADGSVFEGQFQDNEINGQGTYVWSDGKIYAGEWSANKMHGKGILKWANGKQYEGEFKEDKRHGNGLFIWKDGRVYDGQWKNGKQHGRGVFKNSDGTELVGEWVDGQRIRWMNGGGGQELQGSTVPHSGWSSLSNTRQSMRDS